MMLAIQNNALYQPAVILTYEDCQSRSLAQFSVKEERR